MTLVRTMPTLEHSLLFLIDPLRRNSTSLSGSLRAHMQQRRVRSVGGGSSASAVRGGSTR
jgi:hypothetical protein